MLINNFRNWKLRIKLLFSFLCVVLVALSLSVILFFSYKHFTVLEQTQNQIELVRFKLKAEELAIKNLQHEIYKVDEFHAGRLFSKPELISATNNLLESTKLLMGQTTQLDSQLKQVSERIKLLGEQKLLLQENLLKRGFKDYGLEGKLREAVHAVEQIEGIDKVLLLSLRRHEKDFMLRKDWKYVNDFDKKIALLTTSIGNSNKEEQITISKNIQTYQQNFNALAEAENAIGLTDTSGIRKEIKLLLNNLNTEITSIEENVTNQIKKEKESSLTLILLASLVVIIISVILSIQFANLLTNIIKEIRNGMQTFASGRLPQKLAVLTKEEIGQTKIAFNQLIDRLEAAQSFAVKIGNGKFNDTYHQEFTNDLLAQALIKASKELQIADTIRKENDYVNQGIAKLSEVVSNKEESLEQLSHKLLLVFIHYFIANQGILYTRVFKDEEWNIYPTAFYAYGKKKTIDINQKQNLPPLVEQCIVEKELIYLEEIPRHYIKVTSGLGEALPSSVVLVPLSYRSNIIGILELAFFEKLTQTQLSLLQKLSIQAAAILESKTSETESAYKNEQVKNAVEHANVIEQNLRQELEQALFENDKLKELLEITKVA
jgi:GAF domain-containing protein